MPYYRLYCHTSIQLINGTLPAHSVTVCYTPLEHGRPVFVKWILLACSLTLMRTIAAGMLLMAVIHLSARH